MADKKEDVDFENVDETRTEKKSPFEKQLDIQMKRVTAALSFGRRDVFVDCVDALEDLLTWIIEGKDKEVYKGEAEVIENQIRKDKKAQSKDGGLRESDFAFKESRQKSRCLFRLIFRNSLLSMESFVDVGDKEDFDEQIGKKREK